MENNTTNRVIEGLHDWAEKENGLKKIFGNGVAQEKHFLKSKMDFFNELHKRTAPNANSEEKLLLNVIKGETKKMDRKLYPDPLTRVLVKAFAAIKHHLKTAKEKSILSEDRLTVKSNIPVPYAVKEERNTSMAETKKAGQSPLEILEQKQQSAGLKEKNKADKKLDKDSNNLLPKKRINPNKGHSIY